ncbi:multidrug resistance-associated protein 1-like [Oppia nitens]|uniref:multidrug resistance-associated protein 1-like n=1 Tax=Oppia nitens TaxID=1686743 RepID=UPI0023DBB186|nr:multidrug resistance-associated protein 1-like [Oppia nitens]
MSAVYRKSLVLSNGAKRQTSYGDITNLMAVDCQRVNDNAQWLAYIVVLPLQIILTTGLLFTEFSYTAFSCLALYAWEQPFMNIITKLRDQELRKAKHLYYVFALLYIISNMCPLICHLLIFSLYLGLKFAEQLTAEKIFFSISLMSVFKEILSKLGYVYSTADYTLNQIDLHIREGMFVAIVGDVGSGKSSLLSAIIGDMELIDGTVNVRPGVNMAYVPQQAWIQNATIKQNIMFGKPFDEELYDRVIDSCALRPDLRQLAGGDQTEIGEKGVNLSGGQKQRLSLGRAVYSGADLYLLDDPLSAVDSHVGKQLMNEVLDTKTGCLGSKTRLLVTNQLFMLADCDLIVVLKSGKIVSTGTYGELLHDSNYFQQLIKQYFSERVDDDYNNDHKWTLVAINNNNNNGDDDGSDIGDSRGPVFYMIIFAAMIVGQLLLQTVYRYIYALTIISTCIRLHRKLLARVMHAPMEFFDTTPVGRLLNRFNKDMYLIDLGLPVVFSLESISRSPINSHLEETLNGLSSIRAYDCRDRFIRESDKRIDNNTKCLYPYIMANSWLLVRLQVLTNILVLFAAVFGVIRKDSLNGSDIGLSLSNAITLTGILEYFINSLAQTQANLVSFERIDEYCRLNTEADWQLSIGQQLSDKWPENGCIRFDGYGTRYRQGLDLVIKGIDISIKSGEMIGIVGRTGAGKSSLTLALFRLIEPAMGRIVIDGIDISQLGLHELRSRLTIIPQEPVLFSGTIRSNLDPFDKFSDDELWSVLEQSHLKEFVLSTDAGLDHPVTESGDNMSVGQRQLVCLARALLRHTSILILDEATAAVDVETDALIQQTIRQEFKSCTVLTIAHRINTILDYDRVLVLSDGRVAEFDSPDKLLDDRTTIFYSLAKDAGVI